MVRVRVPNEWVQEEARDEDPQPQEFAEKAEERDVELPSGLLHDRRRGGLVLLATCGKVWIRRELSRSVTEQKNYFFKLGEH